MIGEANIFGYQNAFNLGARCVECMELIANLRIYPIFSILLHNYSTCIIYGHIYSNTFYSHIIAQLIKCFATIKLEFDAKRSRADHKWIKNLET